MSPTSDAVISCGRTVSRTIHRGREQIFPKIKKAKEDEVCDARWWSLKSIERDSVAKFLTLRQDVLRHFPGRDRLPRDIEMAPVAEQPSPMRVVDIDDDSEALRGVVVPFANVGDAAEDHRKIEADDTFVESLCTRSQLQSALVIDREVNVNRQVLV